ncbi:MAG: hypothetical protein IPI50_07730 [Saprospiraceae bacterium]|nr:hypothetical protein [Saprospiraceae bacterium]
MEKLKIVELEKTAIGNLENKENTKSTCCGGSPSKKEDACCKLDEDKKSKRRKWLRL